MGADLTNTAFLKLLDSCHKVLKVVKDGIAESYVDKISLFSENYLLEWIYKTINIEKLESLTASHSYFIEIQDILYRIKGDMKTKFSKEINVTTSFNRFVAEFLKERRIFEDGQTFKYLTKSLQLKYILSNEDDSLKIAEAKMYQTDKKMYQVPIECSIAS